MKILRFFEIFLKISRIFREKIWAKIYKYAFVWVRGRSSEDSEITKNSPKINGNIVFFENFHKLLEKI